MILEGYIQAAYYKNILGTFKFVVYKLKQAIAYNLSKYFENTIVFIKYSNIRYLHKWF